MDNGNNYIEENKALSCLDNLIKEKQAVNVKENNTLKKIDLEQYLEELAASRSITIQKGGTPLQTVYTFQLDGQLVHLEIYYRYSNFYTRHTIRVL